MWVINLPYTGYNFKSFVSYYYVYVDPFKTTKDDNL